MVSANAPAHSSAASARAASGRARLRMFITPPGVRTSLIIKGTMKAERDSIWQAGESRASQRLMAAARRQVARKKWEAGGFYDRAAQSSKGGRLNSPAARPEKRWRKECWWRRGESNP